MTKKERTALIAKAKQLYAAGNTAAEVATIVGVRYGTMRKWVKEHSFEEARSSAPPSISEIVKEISAAFYKRLKEKDVKADEVVKFANAIEKLTDKDKLNFYLLDAFARIKEAMEAKIKAVPQKQKSAWLAALKKVAEIVEQERHKTLRHEGNSA